MRNFVRLLTLLVATTLLMTACSKNDDPAPTPQPTVVKDTAKYWNRPCIITDFKVDGIPAPLTKKSGYFSYWASHADMPTETQKWEFLLYVPNNSKAYSVKLENLTAGFEHTAGSSRTPIKDVTSSYNKQATMDGQEYNVFTIRMNLDTKWPTQVLLDVLLGGQSTYTDINTNSFTAAGILAIGIDLNH
ncbi:hypothetical protein [Polluticoccus soli]|uniref:hypothetical protein n=1 Tax=Polluticoccus soli TaxID=3034150 RepID=UPI0023E0CDEA|nr:hypothetical protein [Flavipsychrobacter sp. JY13-12]